MVEVYSFFTVLGVFFLSRLMISFLRVSTSCFEDHTTQSSCGMKAKPFEALSTKLSGLYGAAS
jgi:hypothetical protein